MRIVAVALVMALTAPAFADLVSNGGFETVAGEPSPPYAFITLNSGDATTLAPWTVGGGGPGAGVDVINSYWQNHGGTHSIDLSATSDGSISQNLATTAGQQYVVRFWMAGNPAAGPAIKTLDVGFGSQTATGISFDTTSTSLGSMGWVQVVLFFTSASGNDVLTFTSTTGSQAGAALDDISVEAVPEPGTYALFGVGLGALAFWRRRSARAKKTSSKPA